ncbi:ribosome hibernation-promoting factor, HPF/YfiA family [Saccharospirillum salsuginis]|uniref:Ribosome hibernation promoting factor n=1 Tax=Saccharospirillum salsuginis TaxID=418750 RepID=A0A918NH75_9GAMM|nr:ribosome-associated translation inhibitor RaiA [Saccharospirillum salsuginis]GGX70230.1 ribosomal subunit interface protein [Saccharospirillum salsuginis]
MQVNISGHHVEVTDALNDYVAQKLEKLERHFDQIGNVQVTLSVEKQRQKAEASVNIKGAQLHADAIHDDLYAAIDLMNDKLDRQLLKHKEKKVDRLHGNAR